MEKNIRKIEVGKFCFKTFFTLNGFPKFKFSKFVFAILMWKKHYIFNLLSVLQSNELVIIS